MISKPALALNHGIVWVAMITSAENAGWPCDIPVSDVPETGLVAPSVMRPWKLATLDVSRIVRIAGRISRDQAAHVSKALAQAI